MLVKIYIWLKYLKEKERKKEKQNLKTDDDNWMVIKQHLKININNTDCICENKNYLLQTRKDNASLIGNN